MCLLRAICIGQKATKIPVLFAAGHISIPEQFQVPVLQVMYMTFLDMIPDVH